VARIHLTEGKVKRQVHMNTVMNLRTA